MENMHLHIVRISFKDINFSIDGFSMNILTPIDMLGWSN